MSTTEPLAQGSTTEPSAPAAEPDPGPAAAEVQDAAAQGAAAQSVPPQDAAAPHPGSTIIWPVPEELDALRRQVVAQSEQLRAASEAIAAQNESVESLRRAVAELASLRARDTEIADRMHAEITRLRAGELVTANAPLHNQLVRLADQMSELASPGDHLDGMRARLLQILDTAAGIAAFSPSAGEEFDARTMSGAGRVDTPDESLEGSVAACLRPGYTRADGSLLRAADVSVHRYVPGATAAGAPADDTALGAAAAAAVEPGTAATPVLPAYPPPSPDAAADGESAAQHSEPGPASDSPGQTSRESTSATDTA